jgi:alkylhydroperoxidase family enzyme
VSGEDPTAAAIFDERDLAAIEWADRVTRNEAHADPAAWARVRESFSQAQAIELTLAVCLFNFMNRFNDTMWLELEDGAPPGPQMHIEPSAFRRYATTMLKGV